MERSSAVRTPDKTAAQAGENVFGVLTSEIVKLGKKIRVNHALAMELWETGNAEARVLALEIADPVKLTRADADRLVKDGPVLFVGWYLSDSSPGARSR